MTKTNKIVAIAAVVGGVLAAATSASAALNLPTQSCSYTFTANLKKGMRHPQVRDLQKVLNMYPQTQVAAMGAGSMGMETEVFGAATFRAVVKFQELHTSDVLSPIGATRGTGNVFSLTRAILNQVCSGTVVTPTTTPATTTAPVSSTVSATLGANVPYTVLVSGQASARLADFAFAGNGVVKNVKLMRTGVSNNNTLTNVYLYDGTTRIAGPASILADGSINFNSVTGLFTVAGTKNISVRSDISLNTSGQSVGVMLAGYNTGAGMVAASINGTQLPVANVSLAGVNFTNSMPTPAMASVNAGTMNYTVWSAPVSVATRAINLRGAAFKVVGSAPSDALANVRLYVDGSAVGSAATVGANGMVSFDLMTTPVVMNSGSHTVEVRADIVKGSARNFQVSLDQASDIWFEDSQLSGVYVTATQGGTNPVVNYVAGVQSIANGTLTVSNVSVGVTQIVGGASNVVIAKYKLSAYGEDMKVNQLSITPILTSAFPLAAGLNNVTVNVNGGAIASGVNWMSGNINFNNLGSNLVIPAGSSTIIEIRADMVNSASTAYTAGQVTANVVAGTNNANGTASNVYVNTNASTAANLTIVTAGATFAKTTGFVNQTVSPNAAMVKIGSFTINANTSENLQVSGMTVNLSPLANITNYTNLTVKDGMTVVGAPVGNPQAMNNISVNTTVTAGSSKTFEVYADIQSGVGAAGAIMADMSLSYRGVQSNVNVNNQLATGVMITPALGGVTSITVNPSPVAQYVVGGTTNALIASYVIKSTTAPMTITKLIFNANALTSQSIQSVTVGGVTAQFVNGVATINGLNIMVPGNNTGATVNANVNYSCFVNGNTGSGCNLSMAQASTSIALVNVEGTTGNSTVTFAANANSAAMTVVASKPTVTSAGANLSGLVNGNNKTGEVTVAADAAGAIELSTLAWSVSPTTGVTVSVAELRESGSVVPGATCTVAGVCTFATPYQITAGSSKTFSLHTVVAGVAGAAGTASVSTSVTQSAFMWNDVNGNGTGLTGAAITNFPTNSYSVKN